MNLPARFYTSAISIVLYTFNAWFETQKSLRFKINGKEKWFQVITTDIELARTTEFTPEAIQARAGEILVKVENKLEEENQSDFSAKMDLIFEELEQQHPSDQLSYRAIAHLLKNSCQVNTEEDPDQLALRLIKKEIEIARLKEQLESRLPKGRDILGERYEQALEKVISLPEPPKFLPLNFLLKWHKTLVERSEDSCSLALWVLYLIYQHSEFELWEQDLPNRMAEASRQWKTLPYPVLWGSAADLYWSQEKESSSDKSTSVPSQLEHQKSKRKRTRKRRRKVTERICVRFKGTELSHLRFSVYCDRRQHPVVAQ